MGTLNSTIVSHIYTPCFATLALVEGLICGTFNILSREYTPFSGAMPRCWHRNIILQINGS